MFEIIFKDIPVKHIHTKYGDFLYSEMFNILRNINFENDENDWDDDDWCIYKIENEDIKNWLIEEKAIKLVDGECYRDNEFNNLRDKLMEYEIILNKLIGD